MFSLTKAHKSRGQWTRFATRAFDIFTVTLIFAVFG
ncbi:hypothetical protein ABENE_18800 [Asticcacaulis benevestitus DSM 16100 = ATCC BAA-896]|uniref:Uncharacterized protein n=1 Tax=Asticcacaulis benevestitus DSM 16100 = ATCC BAA-896 TaxID=1121022 RepID=V4NUT4_9CAUL|nr:hypothetical protein ABENE_18800 [Asticcacaulis benevestitus DSM 16100 = ATCC BAA-896]